MTELSRREFRRVYRRVNGDDPLTVDRLLAVIGCAGKSIHFKLLTSMWPYPKEHITMDEAYSIYIRYDATPLPVELTPEEEEYYKGLKAQDFVDCITHTYPELRNVVTEEMKKFTLENGEVDVAELLKQMEIVRKDAIITLTATSTGPSTPTEKVRQEYEPIEKTTGFRGMLIVSPPLITTTYTIKVPEKCECTIHLKLAVNSNSRLLNEVHPFANDLFLLVLDKYGKFVGVTTNRADDCFSTDEITLENDAVMVVMSLGTTTPTKAVRGKDEKLLKDGKMTKEFKVTLMNIFDMFDLDGDNLLNMDEYNAYCLASGDSPISEGDWKQMKAIVEFRDERMTMRGFLNFHQMEIARGDPSSLDDCWASLIQMGFNEDLKLVNSTPFTIDMRCGTSPLILPKLQQVNKELRDTIISQFYRLGTVDTSCDLEPRTFFTKYFGLTIVDRIRALDNAGYRVEITKNENVKWHFITGQENIKPFTFESELVLICTWVATSKDYKVEYKVIREDGT